MTALELTMDDVHRDLKAVHDWLVAHDLEPNRTQPGVIIRDGAVTATLYVRDADGNIVVERDEFTGQVLGAKTETVNLPLRTPLPAGLGTVTA